MNRAVGQLQFSITRLKDLGRPPVCAAVHRGREPVSQGHHGQSRRCDHLCGRRRHQDTPRVPRSRPRDQRTGSGRPDRLDPDRQDAAARIRLRGFDCRYHSRCAGVEDTRGLMQQVAKGINAVFGTKITPADIVVTLVIAKLIGGFLSLLGVLTIFRGAWGLLVGLVAALGGPLTIVLTIIRLLSGAFVTVAARRNRSGRRGWRAATPSCRRRRRAGLSGGETRPRHQLEKAKRRRCGGCQVNRRLLHRSVADGQRTVLHRDSRDHRLVGRRHEFRACGVVLDRRRCRRVVGWSRGALAVWHSAIQELLEFDRCRRYGALGPAHGLFQAGFDFLSSGWAVIVAAAQAVFDALKALAQGSGTASSPARKRCGTRSPARFLLA